MTKSQKAQRVKNATKSPHKGIDAHKDIVEQLGSVNDTIDRLYISSENMIAEAEKRLELQTMALREQVQKIQQDFADMNTGFRAWMQKVETKGQSDGRVHNTKPDSTEEIGLADAEGQKQVSNPL